jgi:hypothetical protein
MSFHSRPPELNAVAALRLRIENLVTEPERDQLWLVKALVARLIVDWKADPLQFIQEDLWLSPAVRRKLQPHLSTLILPSQHIHPQGAGESHPRGPARVLSFIRCL